ncbi:16838_t:CDS:2 [Dentiscutata heterogama]|uniref:16838_t:CDS:1 n=1 Tax=Dentiscutata heterogama TaxID=1316150 RepID=A0ACA9MIG3_9GLOM|nr:16838_t:CDS:2 [Dentiscutata heterogama]
MGGSDSTKPIYHGHNDKDVEEFLEDYEAYDASKDWSEDKMRQVIRLHVSDDLKPWIRKQIKAKNTWTELKAAITSGTQTSGDVEEKLKRLKNAKQKSNDTIKACTNWFDAGLREPFKEKVKMQCPETYEDAKKFVVLIKIRSIKELTMAVMNLKENRPPNVCRYQTNYSTQGQNGNNLNQTARSRRCYECNQDGHIS